MCATTFRFSSRLRGLVAVLLVRRGVQERLRKSFRDLDLHEPRLPHGVFVKEAWRVRQGLIVVLGRWCRDTRFNATRGGERFVSSMTSRRKRASTRPSETENESVNRQKRQNKQTRNKGTNTVPYEVEPRGQDKSQKRANRHTNQAGE